MSKNGNGEGTPPVIENAHIFQEYTYKKITPCDICSQILRGKVKIVVELTPNNQFFPCH